MFMGFVTNIRYGSEPVLAPIVFFSWQGSRKRRKLQKLWEPWWVCSLSAGCPSLSQTSLVSKTSVSLFIIFIPIITDTRPKPAYGQQGLDWECGARMQFRRVQRTFWGVLNVWRCAFGAQLALATNTQIQPWESGHFLWLTWGPNFPAWESDRFLSLTEGPNWPVWEKVDFFVMNGMQFEEVIIFHNKQTDTSA